MRFLLFEEFSHLNEIKYSKHWLERTSDSRAGEQDSESRIVQYSSKNKYGWIIREYKDKRRKDVSSEALDKFMESIMLTESELMYEIGIALREITRSEKLKRWNSNESKYQLLYLGRIGIYDGEKTIYPMLSTKEYKKEDSGRIVEISEYPPADGIFGVSDRNDGITVMYFPATESGMASFYETVKKNTGIRSELEFRNSAGTYSPYGDDFELIIDGSDPDQYSRLKKLKKQINGEPIKYGPETKISINPIQQIAKQKTISPGMDIGVLIKYVSSELLTESVIKEILNLQDIIKSPSTVEEIKIAVLPKNPEHVRRNSRGEVMTVPITISAGSIVNIGGDKHRIVKERSSIVVNDPRITDRGSVAVWTIKI